MLLAAGERAELATDEYLPLSSLLEGVIILKPNPNHVPTTLDDGKPSPTKANTLLDKDAPRPRINKPLSAW